MQSTSFIQRIKNLINKSFYRMSFEDKKKITNLIITEEQCDDILIRFLASQYNMKLNDSKITKIKTKKGQSLLLKDHIADDTELTKDEMLIDDNKEDDYMNDDYIDDGDNSDVLSNISSNINNSIKNTDNESVLTLESIDDDDDHDDDEEDTHQTENDEDEEDNEDDEEDEDEEDNEDDEDDEDDSFSFDDD